MYNICVYVYRMCIYIYIYVYVYDVYGTPPPQDHISIGSEKPLFWIEKMVLPQDQLHLWIASDPNNHLCICGKKNSGILSLIHSLQMDPPALLCICFLSLSHGHLLRGAKASRGSWGCSIWSPKWRGNQEKPLDVTGTLVPYFQTTFWATLAKPKE